MIWLRALCYIEAHTSFYAAVEVGFHCSDKKQTKKKTSDQKTQPDSEEPKTHLEGQKPPDNISIVFRGGGSIFLRNNVLDDYPIILSLFLFYDKIIGTNKYILAK